MPRKFAVSWNPSERKPAGFFSTSQDALGCVPKVYLLCYPKKKPKRKAVAVLEEGSKHG